MVEQLNASPSAARARRYRERQQDGAFVVPLDVTARDIAGLVAYGLIEKGHAAERTEIAIGIQILLHALSQDAIEVDFNKLDSAA